MRLFGAVLNDGGAVCQHGGQQNVHRRTDGDDVEIHMPAHEAALRRVGIDIAARLINLRAQSLKALDMLVDGAHAEVAAARHRNARVAKAAKLCADEVIRRADAAHQLDRSRGVAHARAVELKRVAGQTADRSAHVAQNLKQKPDVRDVRRIFNSAHAAYQQRGGQHRHRGILRARDGHAAGQGRTAVDHIFNQIQIPLW